MTGCLEGTEFPGGRELDAWLETYITRACSAWLPAEEQPRAAQIMPDFYSAEPRPRDRGAQLIYFYERTLEQAHGEMRKALTAREARFRELLEGYVCMYTLSKWPAAAIVDMLDSGLGFSRIGAMLGHSSKYTYRKKFLLLARSLTVGDYRDCLSIENLFAAYAGWIKGGRFSGKGGDGPSGGEEIVIQGLRARGSVQVDFSELEWSMGAVDDMLDSGVTYPEIAGMMGYVGCNPRRNVWTFLRRALNGEGHRGVSVDDFRRAVDEWKLRSVRTALMQAEAGARESVLSEQKKELLSHLACIVESPGYEHVWLPAFLSSGLITGPDKARLGKMVGCALSGKARDLRAFTACLARDPLNERAAGLRAAVQEALYASIERKFAAADIPPKTGPTLPQHRNHRAREKRKTRIASAVIETLEANERDDLVESEGVSRDALGLLVVQADPTGLFQRAVGALLKGGMGYPWIAGVLRYSGPDPEGYVRGIASGGPMPAQPLETVWRALKAVGHVAPGKRNLRRTAGAAGD